MRFYIYCLSEGLSAALHTSKNIPCYITHYSILWMRCPHCAWLFHATVKMIQLIVRIVSWISLIFSPLPHLIDVDFISEKVKEFILQLPFYFPIIFFNALFFELRMFAATEILICLVLLFSKYGIPKLSLDYAGKIIEDTAAVCISLGVILLMSRYVVVRTL